MSRIWISLPMLARMHLMATLIILRGSKLFWTETAMLAAAAPHRHCSCSIRRQANLKRLHVAGVMSTSSGTGTTALADKGHLHRRYHVWFDSSIQFDWSITTSLAWPHHHQGASERSVYIRAASSTFNCKSQGPQRSTSWKRGSEEGPSRCSRRDQNHWCWCWSGNNKDEEYAFFTEIIHGPLRCFQNS